ncbi:RHS repeat-associated core domain-containing protein [Escherichia fergusonii]|uniref:RHS repeat domain-containing protein n=2 Tax=Escherichia fergusonii TaxID=564 RepID=UPI0030CC672D
MIAEYERDELHREIRRSQGRLSQYRAYNICGHLTRQSSGLNAPELVTPLLDSRYHRDSRDNLRRLSCQYSQTMPMLREGAPQEDEFSYDARGQVVRHDQDGHSETFRYDAAMNGLRSGGYPPRLPDAPANQVTLGGEFRYTWDGFGRLARRENVRTGVKQRMHYDDAHRLVTVEILNDRDWSRVTFSYDALGRRTEKRAWRQGAEKPERTVFEWSGMRLCGEHNEKSPAAHTLYLYEENSYQPLARVDRSSGGNEPWQRVLYYHTLPNGYPQCMTDSDGGIVWRARVQLWGNIRFEENRDIYSIHPQQNLRFAGQYLDRETGLHYNTFRYFLPESGRFSQPDPISLEGGINLYQYAPNPLGWIDPWGLTAKDLANNMEAAGRPLSPGQTPHHAVKENANNIYAEGSRNLIAGDGADPDVAENGARLWGTHPNQVGQPEHPGVAAARNTENYHAGTHIHGKFNDMLIYKILRNAKRKGINTLRILAEITKRMESGLWKKSFRACGGK